MSRFDFYINTILHFPDVTAVCSFPPWKFISKRKKHCFYRTTI